MTPERRQLVINSWKSLAPAYAEAGAAFYRHLFELDPSLRPLFSSAILDGQTMKFMAMMEMLVHWLDAPERLVPVAKELGARHLGYGVHDEHYSRATAALLAMLEERLADRFTVEVRSAWSEAMLLITSLMRRGAARVSGQFPVFNLEPAPKPTV